MSGLPYFGRRQPYTERGISRVPCTRCGQPSVHQWQACANGRRYVGLCAECDVALNALVLRFARIPRAAALLAPYRRKVLGS